MATNADANIGYKGTVSSADTPSMFGRPAKYSVGGASDLRVTLGGTGSRAISVAAGKAWGDAVLSKFSTSTNLNGATVSSGTRWDTVVIRRTWSPGSTPTGTATLMILQGGSAKAIAGTRTTDAGDTTSDQPIALVQFAAGQTAAQDLVDLRVWAGNGALYAADPLVQQYLTDAGSAFIAGSTLYVRTVNTATSTLAWYTVDLGKLDHLIDGTGTGVHYTRLSTHDYGVGTMMTVRANETDGTAPSGDVWYVNTKGPSPALIGVTDQGVLSHVTVPQSLMGKPTHLINSGVSAVSSGSPSTWDMNTGSDNDIGITGDTSNIDLHLSFRLKSGPVIAGGSGGIGDLVVGHLTNPAHWPAAGSVDCNARYYTAAGGTYKAGVYIRRSDGAIVLYSLSPNIDLPVRSSGNPSLVVDASYLAE